MNLRLQHNVAIAIGLAFALGHSTQTWGQSGTKALPRSGQVINQVSGTAKSQTTVALNGYCTVCVIEMKQWIKGDARFSLVQDGKTYLFPSDEQKQMFLKNPAKYANEDLAAQGQCVVCRVEMQKEVPGKPEFVAIHKDMRYWFPSEEQLKMFVANPTKYEAK